jgi:hypothetical protein
MPLEFLGSATCSLKRLEKPREVLRVGDLKNMKSDGEIQDKGSVVGMGNLNCEQNFFNLVGPEKSK